MVDQVSLGNQARSLRRIEKANDVQGGLGLTCQRLEGLVNCFSGSSPHRFPEVTA
jgi:hypothetical protein